MVGDSGRGQKVMMQREASRWGWVGSRVDEGLEYRKGTPGLGVGFGLVCRRGSTSSGLGIWAARYRRVLRL